MIGPPGIANAQTLHLRHSSSCILLSASSLPHTSSSLTRFGCLLLSINFYRLRLILTFSSSDRMRPPYIYYGSFLLTMDSADFCQYPLASLALPAVCRFATHSQHTNITNRSLRVRIYAVCSCSRPIYVVILRTVQGFCFFCNIARITPPCMQFLFVGPNVCGQLLSDSQSPATHLLLANTPYCKAYSGLTPYS